MSKVATLTMNPTVDHGAQIDRVVPDKKLRCGKERFDPGGGGINVASAIHQLGGRATAIMTQGGTSGETLAQLLQERQIATKPVPISGRTRMNVIITETDEAKQFRFGFPGPTVSESEQQACLDELLHLSPPPSFLVLSGSLPPGVPDSFYARISEAMPEETRIVLDVSGEPLRQGLQAPVFLIKPNQRELGQISGRQIESDHDTRDAALQLIEGGQVQIVMVSLGRGGAYLVTADEEVRIHAPTVKIKSKIGAGDSTVAGAVLALSRGESVEEAARFGVACGSAAVTTAGTQLCRREDAERLYAELLESARRTTGVTVKD
jgi:6-phosphofructokinase 2